MCITPIYLQLEGTRAFLCVRPNEMEMREGKEFRGQREEC